MRKPFTLLLLFVLPLLAQQAQAPVEITSEPHHHQVLDNLFVRVFAVSVDPGASTLMHHHGHNYLGISIGDAQFTNTKEGAQPVAATLKDGDVRYSAAPLNHAITNTASTPFRNVTIELLQPTTNEKTCTDSCSVPVTCSSADKSKCATVTKLITADQWTVTQVTVPPGATYPQHTHLANFLVVPLTDAQVAMKNQDKAKTTVHSKTGEVTWNNPVVHSITNTGKTTAKTIVLEFRGRPAGEGSESPDASKPHEH